MKGKAKIERAGSSTPVMVEGKFFFSSNHIVTIEKVYSGAEYYEGRRVPLERFFYIDPTVGVDDE